MFSVLMATYSGENPDYLRECLKSLQNQTLKPGEIVLVKDGPLSRELDCVIDEFKDLPFKIILYLGNENLGGALRLGVEHCKFSIVARMDSDDIAASDRFERQISFMNKYNVDVLGSAIEEFNESVGDIGRIRSGAKYPSKFDVSIKNPISHMTVIFKKEIVLSSGNYIPLNGFEDWYLWLRAYDLGAKIMNQNDVLVYARTNENFLDRRSGFKYAVQEYQALRLFNKMKLITTWYFFCGLCLRIPTRLFPSTILRKIYDNFLRTKKG